MRILLALACAAGLAAASPQASLEQLYAEAQQAQASGNLPVATAKYEAIVKTNPQLAEAYANLGNLYYQQGRVEQARGAYQKAIALKPGLAGPHFFLGVIAFNGHDYGSAIEHLRRADSLQPSNPQIVAHLGYAEYARSNYLASAAALEKAEELDAANVDVLYHLSKVYSQLAKSSFTQLKRQFPASTYTDLALAHAAETGEDWKTASERYQQALSNMPDNARLRQKTQWASAKAADPATPPDSATPDETIDASLAYQGSQLSGQSLKETVARFRDTVRADSTGDKQTYQRAEAYQVLAYLTSVSVYELDPNSFRSHQLRAQFLEASNKDDEAIAEYRTVLKLNPDVQSIHFSIGTLYWKNQHFEEARTELEAELKLNRNHPDALYELGDIAATSGDAKTAEKYFLEALRLRPNLIEAHYGLEKIYTQEGRYTESLAHLRKVLAIEPAETTAHYRLAAVYRKMGKAADAEKELAIFNASRH